MYFRFFLPEEYYCQPLVVIARSSYGAPALFGSTLNPALRLSHLDSWFTVLFLSFESIFFSFPFSFFEIYFPLKIHRGLPIQHMVLGILLSQSARLIRNIMLGLMLEEFMQLRQLLLLLISIFHHRLIFCVGYPTDLFDVFLSFV